MLDFGEKVTTREEFLELGRAAVDKAMKDYNTAPVIRKVYVSSAKAYAMLAAVAEPAMELPPDTSWIQDHK